MDYFESKKLREERGEVVSQMQEITRKVAEEKREMTSEEMESFDKLEAVEVELKRKIDSAERVEKVSAITVDPVSRSVEPYHQRQKLTYRDHSNAFKAWSVAASGHDQVMRSEWRDSADRLGVNLNSSSFTFKLNSVPAKNLYEIERAQTVGTDSEGGYSASDHLIQGVEKSLLAWGNMRSAARVIRTADGNTLPWITVDDTANVADGPKTENAAISNTDVVLGKSSLGAYTYTSGVFPVSLELLQDSSIDFGGLVGELLGERIARKENYVHTKGTGSGEPQGVETGATAGVGCGFTTPDWYSIVVWLKHSIDSGYRGGPSFRYMFSDDVLKELKLAVDDQSRPLWKASMAVGTPDTIDGTPYIINNDCDSVAEGNKFMFCGDFSKFLIRDVNNITVTVLRERYAEKLAVAYIAHHRTDSMVLNNQALRYAWAATSSMVEVPDLS